MGTGTFNAFFNKAQQHLLSLLLGQPERSFYTNEIIQISKCGTGAVQRELKNLTTAGIICVQSIGNQKRYQANPDSPIYSELRAIVLKTFGIADIINAALSGIKEQIDLMFIFGSIAKKTDKQQSDIDLMIISDKLAYADIFLLLEETQRKLHRTINPTIYTQKKWQLKLKDKNNFLLQVLEQPKIFLIGNEVELRKISQSS